jgi:hypothetical protein
VLLILTASPAFAQESENDLKTQAESLFNQDKFVEATSYYLRLIALNPRSTEYNYKYGTCLLFNSLKKQDAFKYLKYSITDPSINPEAYFYLGKAYHLNFQFDNAIQNYNIYVEKSANKPNPKFEVLRQIEMCKNGKKLLVNLLDLVVFDKKEVESSSFFRLYNLSNIGGTILVTADFQSKIDKKRNHIPLIHFPENARVVYYSSYGDSDKGNKDIYCRKRLPDGKWGMPQLVKGSVNTDADEDFPYLTPNGKQLYFSSKGHNSMGGYDVFRADYSDETDAFQEVMNMDFAVSSPDDDLFYVADSLGENAYFASARQSTNGKIHVYKVRVERVPLKLNPNLSQSDLAEMLQQKSILDVNSNSFNLEQLNANKDRNQQLKALGFDGATNQDILAKLEKLEQKQTLKADAYNRLTNGGVNQAYENAVNIEKLQMEVKKLVAESNNTDSENRKKELLLEAKSKLDQIKELSSEAKQSLVFSDSVSAQAKHESKLATSLETFNKNAQTALVSDDITAFVELYRTNESTVKAVQSDQSNNPIEVQAQKNEPVNQQIKSLTNQVESLNNSKKLLETEIEKLTQEKANAKAKEQSVYQSKIESKQQEVSLVDEEIKHITQKIDQAKAEKLRNDEQLVFMNSLIQAADGQQHTKTEALAKMEQTNSVNFRTLAAYVEQQTAKIQSENQSTDATVSNQTNETVSQLEKISSDFQLAQVAVEKQTDLTDTEKQELKSKNLEQYNNRLINELKNIESELEKNPTDSKLLKQKEQAIEKQQDVITQQAILAQQLNNTTSTSDVKAETSTAMLQQLDPSFEANMKATASIASTEKRLDAQISTLEELVDKINLSLEAVYDDLASKPMNALLQAKKDTLLTLKNDKEQEIAEIQQQLSQFQSQQADALSSVNIDSEFTRVLPNYDAQKATFSGYSNPDNLYALIGLDSTSLLTINQELTQLKSKTDAVSKKRLEVLEDIKEQLETNLTNRKAELKSYLVQLDNATANTNTNTTVNLPTDSNPTTTIQQQYQNELLSLAKKTPEEKLIGEIQAETKLINQLASRKEVVESALETSPAEQNLIFERNAIDSLMELHDEQLAEKKQLATAKEVQQLNEQDVLKKLAPTYKSDATDGSQAIDSKSIEEALSKEEKLQETLNQAKQANELQLKQEFTSKLAAENVVIDRILEQSEKREQRYKRLADQANAAIAHTEPQSLSKTLGDEYDFTMNKQPESVEEAKTQLSILNELEGNVTQFLEEEVKKQIPNSQNTSILNRQLLVIKERKLAVENELKSLESKAKQEFAAKPENKLVALKKEQDSLMQLEAKATGKEKQELQNQLATNQAAQAQQDKLSQEIRNEELRLHVVELTKTLENTSTNLPIKQTVFDRVATRPTTTVIDKTANLTLIEATLDAIELQQQLEQNQLIVLPASAIQTAKRRFEIEIGELERERSELSPEQKTQLNQTIAVLQTAIQQLDNQEHTLAKEQRYDAKNDAALNTPISPKTELEITSHPNYSALRAKQQQVNQAKWELNTLYNQLDTLRLEMSLVNRPSLKDTILKEMKAIEKAINLKQTMIQQLENELNNELNAQNLDLATWKNVLVRELPASKPQNNLSELIAPKIGEGFELTKNKIANEEAQGQVKAIQIGVKAPSGLVYRVQVGAFAKPIPEQLFSEFSPVTGEKLDNGITRYLAGYFGDRQKVLQAQKDIKALGYTDAFVVAYCDGKRITLAEARELEDKGLCKPMPQNQIVMELIQNTIDVLPEEVKALNKTEPKPSDYNKADGAVPAIAAEEIKGLYYSVQVGVFNRPATEEQLHHINPLVTLRLENGQIRYSTGTFLSVEDARPKKQEVIEKGILDAFITAYYNGKRISLQEAKALLLAHGDSILVKLDELPKVEEKPVAAAVVESYKKDNPVREIVKPTVYQLVSKDVFEAYPMKVMNQLRVQGTFFYDATDKRIKSVDYSMPLKLVNAPVLFDTLAKVKKEQIVSLENKQHVLVASWNITSLSGAWANWNLNLTLPYNFSMVENSIHMELIVNSPEQLAVLTRQIERLGGTVVK